MSPPASPHLDIDLRPEEISKDFSNVLKVIRPEWNISSKMVYETSKLDISRGLLNTMIKCYNKDCHEDAIMIRIHSNTNVNHLMSRSTEVACIKILHQLNCAPNILASFKNGFCYEYIHGDILNHLRLREYPIWKLTAEDLATMHSVTILNGETLTGKPNFFQMIEMMIAGYPDSLPDPEMDRRMRTELPNKETLLKEVSMAKAEALKINSPIVLCHNDTRAENMVWQAKPGVLHFVDFEGMNYNYQASEIANHFSRYAGFTPPDMSLIPSNDFQLKWLNVYLRQYYKRLGFNPYSVTPIDVRKLFVQVSKFYMFTLISAGIAGPVMAAKAFFDIEVPEVDFMAFSAVFVKEYFKKKEELLQLKMP